MDEIFKQYGSTIITVLAILALVGIITLVIGAKDGIVYQEFSNLIQNFYKNADDIMKSTER